MRRALLVALTAIGFGGLADARATEVHTVVGTLGYDIQRDVLPLIDFAIGAECVFQELRISEVIELVRQGIGPVSLAPGAYEAALLEAGGACSGAPLVTGRADVPASPLPGQADSAAALVVAELDASGAPRIRTFSVNTAALGGRRSRVTFFHTAEAAALDLQLQARRQGDQRVRRKPASRTARRPSRPRCSGPTTSCWSRRRRCRRAPSRTRSPSSR